MVYQSLISDVFGWWGAYQPNIYEFAPVILEGVGTSSIVTCSAPPLELPSIADPIFPTEKVSGRRHFFSCETPVAGQNGRAIIGRIRPSVPGLGLEETRVAAELTTPSVGRNITWRTAKAACCPTTTGNGASVPRREDSGNDCNRRPNTTGSRPGFRASLESESLTIV